MYCIVCDAVCRYVRHFSGVTAFVSDRRHGDSTYNWVPLQGLGSAPDVPHAVNASSRKTEGNGVGVTKEPPVSVRVSETGGSWLVGVGGGSDGNAPFRSLCFTIRLNEHEVTWETVLVGSTLFIETPPDILPAGSKERYNTVVISTDFFINSVINLL